ncbi:MAG TPA: hypothetical protein ENJ91_09010, partial [Rhodobacteraceae bacterium]|nr:hypothetical protein [Paracoccaceae bacterium]
MQIKTSRYFTAIAFGAVMSLPAIPARADGISGLSGAYLAARHASFYSDYKAGAEYYTKALMRDPSNPMLLENTLMSFVGLGDIERALPIARKMQADGVASQMMRMVLVADLVKKEKYDDVIAMLDSGETIGPLVDGLIRAWAELGRGKMTAALVAFDKVVDTKGTRSFG